MNQLSKENAHNRDVIKEKLRKISMGKSCGRI